MARTIVRTPQGTEIEVENGVGFEEVMEKFVALGVIPQGAIATERVVGDTRVIETQNPTAAQKA